VGGKRGGGRGGRYETSFIFPSLSGEKVKRGLSLSFSRYEKKKKVEESLKLVTPVSSGKR